MSKKVGSNEKCPCGSGLKYKKCCNFEIFKNLTNGYSKVHSKRKCGIRKTNKE